LKNFWEFDEDAPSQNPQDHGIQRVPNMQQSPEVGGLAEEARKLSIEPNRVTRSAKGRAGAIQGIDNAGKSVMNSADIQDHDDSDQVIDSHVSESAIHLDDDVNPQNQRTSSAETSRASLTPDEADLLWQGLPIVFQAPGDPGHGSTLVKGPDALECEIRSLWRRMRSEYPTYKIRLDRTIKKYWKHLDMKTCLRTHALPNRNRARDLFKDGGVAEESADDLCMKNHFPCSYLIDMNGDPTLCIVPLPAKIRGAKKWTDIGYWIPRYHK
jgi:hypothetical protein